MIVRINDHKWGFSELLYETDSYILEKITGYYGSCSSRHYHANMHNVFFVISGVLRIDVYEPYLTCYFLRDGESLSVPPGVQHRMVFESNVIGLEVYYSNGFTKKADIERMDVGSPPVYD